MSNEKKETKPVKPNPADFGIDAETANKGAAVAKCKPDQVIGYREYDDKAVVVVHTDTGVKKVEGPKPAEKGPAK